MRTHQRPARLDLSNATIFEDKITSYIPDTAFEDLDITVDTWGTNNSAYAPNGPQNRKENEKMDDILPDNLPDDLREYVTTHTYPYDTEITKPRIRTGSLLTNRATVFFPDKRCLRNDTMVIVHIPGGFHSVVDGDARWASNQAEELSALVVTLNHDTLTHDPQSCDCVTCSHRDGFDRLLSECELVIFEVEELSAGPWKDDYSTHETRIVMSGSSIGGSAAAILALRARERARPMLGLILLVPVTDTNPDLGAEPWGDVKYSPGLTPERLLGLLNTTFKHSTDRDHWDKNISKWPDARLKLMPPTIFALAEYDILSPSAIRLGLRMQLLDVSALLFSVKGIHQEKDLGLKAGMDMARIVLYWCTTLLQPADFSAEDLARRIGLRTFRLGKISSVSKENS